MEMVESRRPISEVSDDASYERSGTIRVGSDRRIVEWGVGTSLPGGRESMIYRSSSRESFCVTDMRGEGVVVECWRQTVPPEPVVVMLDNNVDHVTLDKSNVLRGSSLEAACKLSLACKTQMTIKDGLGNGLTWPMDMTGMAVCELKVRQKRGAVQFISDPYRLLSSKRGRCGLIMQSEANKDRENAPMLGLQHVLPVSSRRCRMKINLTVLEEREEHAFLERLICLDGTGGQKVDK